MKKFDLVYFIVFACFLSCDKKVKNTPDTISKEVDFISAKLDIQVVSKDQIIALTTIQNTSKDTVLLYKPLLPCGINFENQFGLLSAKTYNPVDFKRKRNEKYIDDDGYYIIPSLEPDKLFYLLPDSSISCSLNLAELYDFKRNADNEENEFLISYSVFMPVIKELAHIAEIDSVDGRMKPVYYFIIANNSKNIDSIRVPFNLK